MLENAGFAVQAMQTVPDEEGQISAAIVHACDILQADLVITTGGTGLSPRDVTPEATLAVLDREIRAIPVAMWVEGLKITPRAMLTRSVCVIRKKSLILNLPGSPKAVSESLDAVLDTFPHALDMLRGSSGDCAR